MLENKKIELSNTDQSKNSSIKENLYKFTSF